MKEETGVEVYVVTIRVYSQRNSAIPYCIPNSEIKYQLSIIYISSVSLNSKVKWVFKYFFVHMTVKNGK